MVSLSQLTSSCASTVQYRCRVHLNIYDSPRCDSLATQATAGRHLRIVLPQGEESKLWSASRAGESSEALKVVLCEDDYPGWVKMADIEHLQTAPRPYQPTPKSREDIEPRLSTAIAFTYDAMQRPNEYLWGGTIGPNYDCSGLMQAAFRAAGIWLPRDAYQQEPFTRSIPLQELQPGDLVFFGSAEKATHVGLYLGEGRYIHSSGKEVGRNCVGIDSLCDTQHPVSRHYSQQLRGAGRVMSSYQPGI